MAYAFNDDKTKLNIKIATKSVSVMANNYGSVNFTKTDFGLGENEDLPLGVIILSVQQGSGRGFTARETHPYQTAYVDKTYIYPRGEISGSYDGHITQLRAYVWNDASSQQSIDVTMVIAY